MTFQERYRYNPKTDLIGKGGFARVYKARDVLLDREVAIKVFYVSDKGHYTVIEEIKKAIRLQHPNLLRYYDVAVLDTTNALGETDTLQIGVMEYANAGDLKQYARRHPGSPQLFRLLQQVLSGLEYLHHKGIIHRDLKPQNILLLEEDGELIAKISDFGISKAIDTGTNSSSMAIGTIEYMAPEQFSPNRYGINGRVGTNADLWSFGIMVHELLTNQPLFGQRSGNVTAEQIMSAILSAELPQDVDSLPEPYRDAVKKCLVRDAKERVQKAKEIIHFFDGPVERAESNRETEINEMPATSLYIKPPVPEDEPLPTAVLPVWKEREKTPASARQPDDIPAASPPQEKKTKWLVPIIGASVLIIIAAGYFFGYKASGTTDEPERGKMIAEARTFLENKEYSQAIALIDPWMEKYKSEDEAVRDTAGYLSLLPLYTESLLMTGDTAKAVPYLQEGNESDSNRLYQLGMLYYNGRFVEQSYERALGLFMKGTGLRDTRAETMLGNMYFMGQDVATDYSVAVSYYISAADKNNSVAKYGLGMAYLNGTGVNQNNEEAKKWFQAVIEQNDNAEATAAALNQLNEVAATEK